MVAGCERKRWSGGAGGEGKERMGNRMEEVCSRYVIDVVNAMRRRDAEVSKSSSFS